MSSYFDKLTREVSHAADVTDDDNSFLSEVASIERCMWQDVRYVTGDREFPDDLRQKIMGLFATRAVFALDKLDPTQKAVEYATMTRSSQLIDDMHECFHDLARRRIETRFGMLSDSPSQILVLRDDYDAEQNK